MRLDLCTIVLWHDEKKIIYKKMEIRFIKKWLGTLPHQKFGAVETSPRQIILFN